MNYNSTSIILSSSRLLFRQHIPEDINAYCTMEMDTDVRRYVGGQPRSREDAQQRFTSALQPVTDRLGMWATVLKEDSQYIGRCGIYPHFNHDGSTVPEEGTLAFYIARPYWGQGFATEAGQAFIEFGFNELKLKRIVAHVQAGNEASVHILKKLGFELKSTEVAHRTFYHFQLKNPVT
ncbi:GNAT family N-acetyltransferase [Mucilaginibacter sp. BT774]|uniref:GNAT family N-acetyltransferase n=1 Tax=Mucilaginibacter sp. BT774 TaxID=3062276 RepID=UPI002676674C|nr:GNAT family N-acetyltransferase [Mucilaginibacter sp. BT774]MDO3627915.1 GNAT family N-acetyltransferase [Mucilaginibacter sp. BT774]